MIRVKEVTIKRVEGTNCDKEPRVYSSLVEADRALSFAEHTFPREGYDKHEINIIYENEDEYAFRLDGKSRDNQFFDESSNSIVTHIQNSFNFYTKEDASPEMEKIYKGYKSHEGFTYRED